MYSCYNFGHFSLSFDWYSNIRVYTTGAMLHLDHAIGEYNVMTRIGNIDFQKLGLFQSMDSLKSLDDLKTEINTPTS